MSEDASPTLWLRQLQQGNRKAAERLWETYYGQLVVLARRKLEGRARLAADEEDVALSAFRSFCRGWENRRFPDITCRDDLWKLLVTITLHKVLHLVRDANRQKRGGHWTRLEEAGDEELLLAQLAGSEPTPEFAAEVAEQCEHLLKQLPSPELVELAVLKMEGYSNDEIAAKWGRATRTVERKLQLIRQIWRRDRPAP
ncbi:MAG: ECF-type sigma factor [Pirellulales bacterium]